MFLGRPGRSAPSFSGTSPSDVYYLLEGCREKLTIDFADESFAVHAEVADLLEKALAVAERYPNRISNVCLQCHNHVVIAHG